MPIHLIWGDDFGARDRAIENLIQEIVDPTWISMNLSRVDGSDSSQINKVLDEVRTPPFGNGARVVLVKKSPFCNNCTTEIANKFEGIIELIPDQTHLILSNSSKPDGRLKTTKRLKKLTSKNQVLEKSFVLPPIWDEAGQKNLVERTAQELGLSIEDEAIFLIVQKIGNESSKLFLELEKLALLEQSKNRKVLAQSKKLLITAASVNELIRGETTNVFQIGDCLLEGKIGEALSKIDTLLNSGEPALRILASLTTQTRGWLWVSLLDNEGKKDVGLIAKAAGIANPKRIYVIRKQIQGKPSILFLNLLSCLIEIEAALKKGMIPSHAFKDNLLKQL